MASEGGRGFFGFLGFLLLCVLLGSLLGELLGVLVTEGTLHDIFVKGYHIAWGPSPIDLRVFNFSFNVGIKLNLFSFLGIALGFLFFRK